MIEKNINNLKDRLMNVRMSADDKHDVFKRISLVVDKIESVSSEFHKAPVLSPFSVGFGRGMLNSKFASNLFVYIRQRKFAPSLVVVLLLCVTGGFSAFAEDALPGDSLYSLKVNVNEQVKGMVAVTPEAKARYAVETTERRLQEAVILSSQGKLTDERKQILQGQLSKNANDVKNSVATLVASNDISIAQEVAINFEASLKTHELILETLEKANDLQNASTTNNASSTKPVETDNATVEAVVGGEAGTTGSGTTTEGINEDVSASTTSTGVSSTTASSTKTDAGIINSSLKSKLNEEGGPVTTLMQDIRQEINNSTQVREDLSKKEIAQDSDPVKIIAKIKDAKIKYSNLNYQRMTLTNLGYPSTKIFNSYLKTASSTIVSAEKALQDNDYAKSIGFLQQALKAMSDSDSLISIELNGKPEIKKALELIDVDKLIDGDKFKPALIDLKNQASNITATSTSVVMK